MEVVAGGCDNDQKNEPTRLDLEGQTIKSDLSVMQVEGKMRWIVGRKKISNKTDHFSFLGLVLFLLGGALGLGTS